MLCTQAKASGDIIFTAKSELRSPATDAMVTKALNWGNVDQQFKDNFPECAKEYAPWIEQNDEFVGFLYRKDVSAKPCYALLGDAKVET